EHAPLSAHERTLLLPAAAEVAADRRSISLVPDQALAPGGYYLLVSPRLKDELGRRLAGNGARFAFHAVAPPPTARLQFPPAAGAASQLLCAPPACGPQSFACAGSLRIDGLQPASDYTLSVTARDDFGFVLRAAPQPFSTVASLPRALVSEVMASGVEGEYVELVNLGPGAADLEALALQGSDGIVRPLLASPPPLPAMLAPG